VTDLPPASSEAVHQSNPLKALNLLQRDRKPPRVESQKIDNFTPLDNNGNCNSKYLTWKKKKQKMKLWPKKKQHSYGANSLQKKGEVDKVKTVKAQRSKLLLRNKTNLKKLILTKVLEKVLNLFVLEMFQSTTF
jgi:hypothetical protein